MKKALAGGSPSLSCVVTNKDSEDVLVNPDWQICDSINAFALFILKRRDIFMSVPHIIITWLQVVENRM